MKNLLKASIAAVALGVGVAAVHAAETTQARIADIRALVQPAFVEKRYGAIDALAAGMTRDRTRLADGRWELPFVTTAFAWDLKPHDDAAWEKRIAQVDDWIARAPKDPTPWLVKGQMLIFYASDARGGGWSNTVSEPAWQKYHARLAAARHVLESSAAVSRASPEWFAEMQYIALGEGWAQPAYTALFDEAVRREPTYYFYYFNAGEYFLPRWHGSDAELRRFVDDAVRRTQASEGQTLYARVWWSLLWAVHDKTFAPGRAEWPRMRQGFEDILRVYPDNWNANAFAFYACMAGDWPTYASASRRMSSPELALWATAGLSPTLCSERASHSTLPQR